MPDGSPRDDNLATSCEAPKAPNVAHLWFLRWLSEQGRLEHLPVGPPSGALADQILSGRLVNRV